MQKKIECLVIAMLLLGGCSGLQLSAPTPTSPPTPVDVTAEQVIAALKAKGFDPGEPQRVSLDFLHTAGLVYPGIGAGLQIYSYSDPAAAATDAAPIAPDGVGFASIDWVDDPHFYRAERLIVLYVGHDAAVLQALRDVLGEPFASGRGWGMFTPSAP